MPVLLALTDRVPARRVYLVGTGLTALSHLGFAFVADGFWSGLLMRALAGVGWAGAVSFAAASLFDMLAGPSAAFLFGGLAAAAAFAIALTVMPRTLPTRRDAAPHGALLDFRPVLRNCRAMAWIVGYTVHTWEMAAPHEWAVAFLAATAARLGAPAVRKARFAAADEPVRTFNSGPAGSGSGGEAATYPGTIGSAALRPFRSSVLRGQFPESLQSVLGPG